MSKLNNKVKALMLDAIKTTGSYDPNETMFLFEESLTFKEAEVVQKFMTWVNADSDTRYFGSANIDERYTQFKEAV